VNPEIRLGLMPPGRKAKWRRGGHTSTTATCAPAAKPLILRRPTAPDKVWPRPSSCLDIKSLSSNQKIFEVIHYFTQSHLTHRNEMSITPNVSATGVLSVTDWTPPPIDRLNFTQNCDLAGEFYGTWFQGLLDLEPGADPLPPINCLFPTRRRHPSSPRRSMPGQWRLISAARCRPRSKRADLWPDPRLGVVTSTRIYTTASGSRAA